MFRLAIAVSAALTLTSCIGAKPVIRTTDELVKDSCAMFFSKQRGISFEDAARTICTTREVLEPFYRHFLEGQRRAGAEAELGLARADGGAP